MEDKYKNNCHIAASGKYAGHMVKCPANIQCTLTTADGFPVQHGSFRYSKDTNNWNMIHDAIGNGDSEPLQASSDAMLALSNEVSLPQQLVNDVVENETANQYGARLPHRDEDLSNQIIDLSDKVNKKLFREATRKTKQQIRERDRQAEEFRRNEGHDFNANDSADLEIRDGDDDWDDDGWYTGKDSPDYQLLGKTDEELMNSNLSSLRKSRRTVGNINSESSADIESRLDELKNRIEDEDYWSGQYEDYMDSGFYDEYEAESEVAGDKKMMSDEISRLEKSLADTRKEEELDNTDHSGDKEYIAWQMSHFGNDDLSYSAYTAHKEEEAHQQEQEEKMEEESWKALKETADSFAGLSGFGATTRYKNLVGYGIRVLRWKPTLLDMRNIMVQNDWDDSTVPCWDEWKMAMDSYYIQYIHRYGKEAGRYKAFGENSGLNRPFSAY